MCCGTEYGLGGGGWAGLTGAGLCWAVLGLTGADWGDGPRMQECFHQSTQTEMEWGCLRAIREAGRGARQSIFKKPIEQQRACYRTLIKQIHTGTHTHTHTNKETKKKHTQIHKSIYWTHTHTNKHTMYKDTHTHRHMHTHKYT